MPLFRYFCVIGSALLGLLFFVDWYLPSNANIASPDNDVDRTIIRIHSSQKWPAAVQFDTNVPIIAHPVAVAEAPSPVRQAYAYAPALPQKASENVRRHVKPAPSSSHRDAPQKFANYYRSSDPRNW